MPIATEALLLASCLGLSGVWLAGRVRASAWSRRRMAVSLVVGSMFLPSLLSALGLLQPGMATLVGLLILVAAIAEGAMVPRRELSRIPAWPRRAWIALGLAVLTIHLLALFLGSWPYLPQYALFAVLLLLWWVRIDREMVVRGIQPVWLVFTALMIVLLPFGVLGNQQEIDSLNALTEASPYWNPLFSVLGLEGRWSGMFTHPNALGAFAAMGFGLALVGKRVAWPLLVMSVPLLLVSASRTAGLAAIGGALIFSVLRQAQNSDLKSTPKEVARSQWVRVGALLAVGVVGLVTWQSLARDAYAKTGTGRLGVWETVPGLLGRNWLWGLGPEAREALVASGRLPAWAGRLHSVVFEHLLFSGVIGVTAVLLLLGILVVTALGDDKGGLPLLVVTATLALGDNYAHLFNLTMGVLGFVAVIASSTPVHPRSGLPPGYLPDSVAIANARGT